MIFDAVIYALLALAVVMGFRAGLLRSLATILGYVLATPVALGTAPALSLYLARHYQMPPTYNGFVIAGILIFTGWLFAALLKRAVGDIVGQDIGIGDRLAGMLLGGTRILLVAVLVVAIFDRIIPPGRQPPFLKESQLYPYLSAAAQAGLRRLPPDVAAYIDRLKSARGL
jgi:membrane protein required for colicin V production